MLKLGVRWNTVSRAACSAITGMAWMPDEPVPMTPTRLPVKSTPSCGQAPVWYVSPAKRSRPGMSGTRAVGQAAGRHDQEAGGELVAALGATVHALGGLVEVGAR